MVGDSLEETSKGRKRQGSRAILVGAGAWHRRVDDLYGVLDVLAASS
jgi:hypothetical protein